MLGNEKIFTTEQVANILQVHPFTILKFLKQGKLKGIKLGRVYRIKESDVIEFLEERSTKPRKRSQKAPKVKESKPDVNSAATQPEEHADSQSEGYYSIF